MELTHCPLPSGGVTRVAKLASLSLLQAKNFIAFMCRCLFIYGRSPGLEEQSGTINELSGNSMLASIVTPLQAEKWSELLGSHPDHSLVEHILQGLQQGFHIGNQRGGSSRQ